VEALGEHGPDAEKVDRAVTKTIGQGKKSRIEKGGVNCGNRERRRGGTEETHGASGRKGVVKRRNQGEGLTTLGNDEGSPTERSR